MINFSKVPQWVKVVAFVAVALVLLGISGLGTKRITVSCDRDNPTMPR